MEPSFIEYVAFAAVGITIGAALGMKFWRAYMRMTWPGYDQADGA